MTSPAAEPDRSGRPALPEQTRDDLEVGWGDRADDAPDDDERFLRERPPHWD